MLRTIPPLCMDYEYIIIYFYYISFLNVAYTGPFLAYLAFYAARHVKNGINHILDERHERMLDAVPTRNIEELVESIKKSRLLKHNVSDVFSDEVYLPLFNTKFAIFFLFFYFSITLILIIFASMYLIANFSVIKQEYLKLLKSQKIFLDNQKKKLKTDTKTSGMSTTDIKNIAIVKSVQS